MPKGPASSGGRGGAALECRAGSALESWMVILGGGGIYSFSFTLQYTFGTRYLKSVISGPAYVSIYVIPEFG